MSQTFELQLTCPRCGTEFETTGHTLVDTTDEADAEVLWQLQNGTLNVATCPNCSAAGLVPVPVLLHDAERELLLAMVPSAQEMDEETLAQTVGPILQSFISSVPEEQQAEYLFHPIVTDDPAAIQAAARGELMPEPYDEDEEYDDADDGEEEAEVSPEEQLEMQKRIELLQFLFEQPDSLQRITTLRQYKHIVDDLFQEMIGVLMQQAQMNQPEVVPVLQKIMNEVEVFRASNPS